MRMRTKGSVARNYIKSWDEGSSDKAMHRRESFGGSVGGPAVEYSPGTNKRQFQWITASTEDSRLG